MKSVPGWIIAFIITGLVALGGLGFWYWGAPSGSVGPHDGPVEKIIISTGTDAKSALLFIAQHYGYFSGHGLEVTLKIHPSGKIACQELQAGTIDIANAADFVVVESVFAGFNSLGGWQVLPRRMTSRSSPGKTEEFRRPATCAVKESVFPWGR